MAPRFRVTTELIQKCPQKGSALDIGCGENPHVSTVDFDNYIGLDINIKTLRKASQDISNVNLICASGSKIPFRNNSFDVVICTETLEHFEKPEEVICEMSRLLKKKGFAVISVPSLSIFQTLMLWVAFKTKTISKQPYQSPHHKREYSKFRIAPHFEKIENLLELFTQKGLLLTDFRTVQSLYMKPRIIYEKFFSKIEPLVNLIFSEPGIGHYTILRFQKT